MLADRDLEDVVGMVRDVLDPLLISRGFGPASASDGQPAVSVLFCASEEEFVRRFPRIPVPDSGGGPFACVDLHVNVTMDAGITDVDIEGTSLAALLQAEGLDDHARDVERLGEVDLPHALATVAASIDALLDDPGTAGPLHS